MREARSGTVARRTCVTFLFPAARAMRSAVEGPITPILAPTSFDAALVQQGCSCWGHTAAFRFSRASYAFTEAVHFRSKTMARQAGFEPATPGFEGRFTGADSIGLTKRKPNTLNAQDTLALRLAHAEHTLGTRSDFELL